MDSFKNLRHASAERCHLDIQPTSRFPFWRNLGKTDPFWKENSSLKQQPLDDERLQTFLCEVEAIINGRPIARVSNDLNDSEELTPNHSLLLKKEPVLPQGVFQKENLYARRRWKQVQYLSDIFWKRWTKEYLPLLQERQKWFVRRNLKPGDVVLIVDDSAPRNSW